ncbi:phosphohydrolase [Scatolibacter rhodanostii]|uniref:phosphohydrolase n=1 Tax=Scatolibacter rhodanostii TaxID=2014781 RepID=UPI0013564429|nr:phosphohydrolase [Scatolibacter rhodanostii]
MKFHSLKKFFESKNTDSVFIWYREHYSDLYAQCGIVNMQGFTQHGKTSCLLHCAAVSYYSYRLALNLRLRLNYRDLIRGGLLHDYFLYNWREPNTPKWHGFSHPKTALKNAEAELTLTDVERDVIVNHMFPLTLTPPKYRESALVCLIDKICCVHEFFHRKNPYPFLNDNLVKDTTSERIFTQTTEI